MLLLCATDNALAILDPHYIIANRSFQIACRIPVFATIRCMCLLERKNSKDLWIMTTDDGICTWMTIQKRASSYTLERVHQVKVQ